ncbi:unnamed protein product [Dibothriocephalus latus]|uniref:Phosphoribulokinase/uridine kinase domain-containing protein n=1 Tax=Dibothriocephalus latus TaxID=60516 RepID=A0A3P7L9C7_DIBLA|nr:unnamed protein product [Dibothriocephalus latus]
MDLKVFVDTDSDERLSRRILRDTDLRGRTVPDILLQYNSSVKPAYDQYIAPTMSIADIIIPRGGENNVAIDIIARHVEKRLKEVCPLSSYAFSYHISPSPSVLSLYLRLTDVFSRDNCRKNPSQMVIFFERDLGS